MAIRKLNAPDSTTKYGSNQHNLTSAFVREAFDKGAELVNWEEFKKQSGQINGTKVTGVGVALSSYVAGSRGFDGLMVVKPDGKLYVHQGIGNLGTHSISDTARPVVTTRVASGNSASAEQKNLGHWSREGVIDLESDAAPGEFQLVIKVSRPVTGGVDHYTTTQIIRRDPAVGLERILQSVRLFEGIFRETVD